MARTTIRRGLPTVGRSFSRSIDDPKGDSVSQIVLHDTVTATERVLLAQRLDDHWTSIEQHDFTPDGLAVA